MRLYAASDLHGKCRYGETIKDGIRRSRADAVVLAGDILNYRRNPDLLRFLDDLPVPVFFGARQQRSGIFGRVGGPKPKCAFPASESRRFGRCRPGRVERHASAAFPFPRWVA